jgi:hypothetical protein
MPTLHNATQTYGLLRASASTGTVTDSSENLELPINDTYKGILLYIDRTAETGTCTLDAHVEFYMPAANNWRWTLPRAPSAGSTCRVAVAWWSRRAAHPSPTPTASNTTCCRKG